MDDSLHWVGATATFTPWLKFLGKYNKKRPLLEKERERENNDIHVHDVCGINQCIKCFNSLTFSGCYVYSSVYFGSLFKSRSSFIGPVADCYLQCKSKFGVSVSTSNGNLHPMYKITEV